MNREDSTKLLIDAIGELDDRFIYEAQSYEKKKHKTPLRKLLPVAACIAVALSLMLSLLIPTLMRESAKSESSQTQASDVPLDTDKTSLDFFVAIGEYRGTTEGLAVEFERDLLFDGTARLIWKYSGESRYRTCSLSLAQSDAIKRSMQSQKDFEEIGEAGGVADGLEGFWICFGDGLVYSPCLKNSNGNVGYGTLFDYEAELIPSEAFTELISGAIGQ